MSTPHGHEANISHPVSGLNEVRAIMMATTQITGLPPSSEVKTEALCSFSTSASVYCLSDCM